MKKCPSCNASMESQLKFCQNCGTNLQEVPVHMEDEITRHQVEAVERQNEMNEGKEFEGTDKTESSHELGEESPNEGTQKEQAKPHTSTVPEEALTKEPPQQKQKPKRDEASKGVSVITKVVVGCVALLIVGLVATHLILSKKFDPIQTLEEVDDAFFNEDYDRFLGIFTLDKNTYVNAEFFFKYVDLQDWDDEIYPQIEEAIEDFEDGETGEITIEDKDGNHFVTMSQKKKLLFYSEIVLEVVPVEVSVYTSEDNVVIGYDGKEEVKLNKDEAVKIGHFAPGIYDFDVTIIDSVGSKTTTVKRLVYNEGRKKAALNFNFYEDAIYFTSDYDNAIVFINGKSTGKKAEDLIIFSLSTNGKDEVYAEYTKDGTKLVSDIIKIDSTNVHITFADVQEKKLYEEIMGTYRSGIYGFYYSFRNDYEYAINFGVDNYLNYYFERGTQISNDYIKFVNDHNDMDYYFYKFLTNEVIDMRVIDENTVEFEANETFEFYSEIDGDWHYEGNKKYTVTLNEGDFYITSIEEIGTPKKTQIDSADI